MTSITTAIKTIYGKPASVTIIDGDWKTGKTNFGLYLSQICKKFGLISRSASNIPIYDKQISKGNYGNLDQSQMEFINNFVKLKMWGFANRFRKIYVFDEAIKNAKNRGAMTKLNKAWFEVIPELSKMKCHLVVITQSDEYVDSIFKNATFLHATWKKVNLPENDPLYRKVVTLKAKKYFPSELEFYPIAPTSLIYDPYQSAIMTLEPTNDQISGLPKPVEIAFEFGDGATSEVLKRMYSLPTRKQAIREVRKGISMLKSKCLVSDRLLWVSNEGK